MQRVEFNRLVPVLRIFDVPKAKEFYEGFLGCQIDWEHTFDDNSPVYMQVSRGALVLHLSEHVGDGTPGSVVHIEMQGIDELHRELTAKNYKYYRPGIDETEWGTRCMYLIDPFGNKLSFNEPLNARKE